ncbi:MAG: AEC family transporter [Clostridiales bacterium]|nr:AEC family transporter [Clostridiales bacterium]
MYIILNQIAVLMILAVIGFVIEKTGYIPKNSGTYISNIVIRLTAPSLIVTTMSSYEFTSKTVKDGLWIAFLALAFMLFGLLLGVMATKMFMIEGATSNVFQAHTMLGNVGYLGLPLLNSLFGQKGLVYANFFSATLEILVWTLGVYLMNKHNGKAWKDNIKNIFSPSMIAFATGLILAAINIKQIANNNQFVGAIYNVIYKTLNPLGNITIYLVMIFIGISLAENGVGGINQILSKKMTFRLSFIKLIVLPATAFLSLHFLFPGLDQFVKTIIILELAMPCAAIVPVLAMQYESDYKFATENVIYSTLFSMLTLPIAMYVLTTFL